jgi:hypothetical protein
MLPDLSAAGRALGIVCLALPCFALSGCLAAAPPLRTELGIGGVFFPHGTGQTADGIASFRAGLFPAQLFPSLQGRAIDVGAGYGYDAGVGFETHTLFAEVDALRSLGVGQSRPVVGFGVAPRVVWDGMRDEVGYGLGARLSLDLLRTFASEYETYSSDGLSYAAGVYGQSSLGVYAEGTFTSLGPYTFGTLTGGLTFRLPAIGFGGL